MADKDYIQGKIDMYENTLAYLDKGVYNDNANNLLLVMEYHGELADIVQKKIENARTQLNYINKRTSFQQVAYWFLHDNSRVNIIKRMGNFDGNKSLTDNCVDFLNAMQEAGRIHEVWDNLSEEVKRKALRND